ncbi:glycosyltransferase family 4 protein [Rhodobacteraceae bacterium MCCB 386]|nr:glycosyltransferase family 4 protein [Roseitranquillus sediminis]
MMELLSEEICGIVTEDAQSSSSRKLPWDHYSLNPTLSVGDRMRSRLGYKYDSKSLLRRLIRTKKPTVVFFNYLDFLLKYWDVVENAGVPVVCHVHGYDVMWDMRRPDDPYRELHEPNYAASAAQLLTSVNVIANSEFTKRQLLANGAPESNVHVKYFSADVEKEFADEAKYSGEARILFLGRLVDCKGPDLVIRAFDHAIGAGMNASLTIAGDGPLRVTCELLRQQSKSREKIHIVGSVSPLEAQKLRASHHIFTAHNRKGPITRQEEAFGVAFLEAMSAGLPVVAGRSGGVPEIVLDGNTGILVTPGDIEAHSRALLSLANCPAKREAMGNCAINLVRSKFSRDSERRRLLEIISIA